MKKSLGMAAVAASLLLVAYGTSVAGPSSPGGVTGADRLRPGTWNRPARRSAPASAPYRVPAAVSPSQTDAGTTDRSFSFEPGSVAAGTAVGTTCCTPLPTCCAPVPACVTPGPVAAPAAVDAAPAPPGQETVRSYSYEPEPMRVYRPRRRSSSRANDRMYRKLHPGSGWRPKQ